MGLIFGILRYFSSHFAVPLASSKMFSKFQPFIETYYHQICLHYIYHLSNLPTPISYTFLLFTHGLCTLCWCLFLLLYLTLTLVFFTLLVKHVYNLSYQYPVLPYYTSLIEFLIQQIILKLNQYCILILDNC